MKTITATPAYGRDYKSKKSVLEAWESGVDFLASGITGSGYFSNRDTEGLKGAGIRGIQFRYNRLGSTFVHPL